MGYISLLKYGGIAIGAGLLIWLAVSTFNNFKSDLIRQGFEQCQDQFKDKVAANDKRNRDVEQSIADEVQKKVDSFVKGQKVRDQIADKLVMKVDYSKLPKCEIPAAIIDTKNQIRKLGPSE